MGLQPQNKGIILVALGTVMIISTISQEWEIVKMIGVVFITLINPRED